MRLTSSSSEVSVGVADAVGHHLQNIKAKRIGFTCYINGIGGVVHTADSDSAVHQLHPIVAFQRHVGVCECGVDDGLVKPYSKSIKSIVDSSDGDVEYLLHFQHIHFQSEGDIVRCGPYCREGIHYVQTVVVFGVETSHQIDKGQPDVVERYADAVVADARHDVVLPFSWVIRRGILPANCIGVDRESNHSVNQSCHLDATVWQNHSVHSLHIVVEQGGVRPNDSCTTSRREVNGVGSVKTAVVCKEVMDCVRAGSVFHHCLYEAVGTCRNQAHVPVVYRTVMNHVDLVNRDSTQQRALEQVFHGVRLGGSDGAKGNIAQGLRILRAVHHGAEHGEVDHQTLLVLHNLWRQGRDTHVLGGANTVVEQA